ncbi:hypothetical protein AAHB46_19960 [Bacillus paranthracis]
MARFFKRIGLKKCGKVLFIGRRVILKNKNAIELGNGVTLGNYVSLDGLSKEGLKIGNNVNIGSYTIIACSGSLKHLGKGMTIGDNSGIGDFSFLEQQVELELGRMLLWDKM